MKKQSLMEIKEGGKLLAETVEIVRELSKNELADTDSGGYERKSIEDIKTLIIRARDLVDNDWWKIF